MQKPCKSSKFGQVNKNRLKDLDQKSFKNIVNQAKKTAPLITNMMFSLKSNFNIYLTFYLALKNY